MWELWLLRLNVSEQDKSEWVFVERIRRGADGQWGHIPFDAEPETPPDMPPFKPF